MKTHSIQFGISLFALVTVVTRGVAADFTNLHDFSFGPTNGASPLAGLILSGHTIYGTTATAGSNDYGTVFALNTDGTGFTNLWNFGFGNDGRLPQARLALSGDTLFGTTYAGGSANCGTVFAVNTNGAGYRILHSFSIAHYDQNGAQTNADGQFPNSTLLLSDNSIYGTTVAGGSGASGTIFKIFTDGTGFANLHNFALGFYNDATGTYTNSDGGGAGGLKLANGDLYGTTSGGGKGGGGTVFKIATDGSHFTNLYHFTPPRFSGSAFTNVEGSAPADLILSGNSWFGTAGGGGNGGSGSLFRINTDGTDFTNLYNFTAPGSGTNCDGSNPIELVMSGGTLFGVTANGGKGAAGTVFAVNTNGSGFTTIYNFSPNPMDSANPDGANPRGALVVQQKTLFGTALEGGANAAGTVFALRIPPPTLQFRAEDTFWTLSWFDPAYSLQATPALSSSFTNVPGGTSPYVTTFDSVSVFFRLKSD